ncbi:MAG: response regulator transcription factor [Chloroflexales bacterium]
MKLIRILVVDDHPMMREALCAALDAERDLSVIGEAANGQQAVQRALALRPDLVVMDLQLPLKDGVTAIAEIVAAAPSIRILAVTSATEDERVVAAVRAGAHGYLLKDAPREQFLRGVRQVAAGATFLPPEVAQMLARGLRQAPPSHAAQMLERLTAREQEVLALLGEGCSNHAIAERLQVSESTVRVHAHNIQSKLGLLDRGHLVAYAARQGQD